MSNMRQFVFGVLAAGALLASAAPAQAQTCGVPVPVSTTLVAGQNFAAGTVSVSNDAAYIYVQYTTEYPVGDE